MDYTAAWKELRLLAEELAKSGNTNEKKYGEMFVDLIYDMEVAYAHKDK
jgi:hypothetical protein